MERAPLGVVAFFIMSTLFVVKAIQAQVANDADGLYDSTSYVETDSTTNTTSSVTTNNTNTNNTTIDSTNTNVNTNTNTSTSTSTNTNINTNNNILSGGTTNTNTNLNTNNSTVNSTSLSTVNQTTNNTNNSTINSTATNTNNNTNTNISTSTSTVDQTVNQNTNSTIDQNVNSSSTATNTNTNLNTNNTNLNSNTSNLNTNNNNNTSNIKQEIKSPPPSAIAPTIQPGGSDTCTVTWSGAVQTQILGMSGGGHVRDINCERLKNAKTLYNMGMKVAAVSLMCQDEKVFKAMKMAGTPCPFEGEIGESAKQKWEENPEMTPQGEKEQLENEKNESFLSGMGFAGLLLLLL